MTRPARSALKRLEKTCALVLDGDEVKARLMAERLETGAAVHVDWLRFSCLLRRAPMPTVDVLFPGPATASEFDLISEHEADQRARRLAAMARVLQKLPDAEFSPAAQAQELAERVCEVLGDGFTVAPEMRKGHDFYRYRWSIERAGYEVGWVGFLASGESPRESALNETMHVNLYGTACTFAQKGWRDHMANLVDDVNGTITRADLALDFFDGINGGMRRIKADYENGLMDNRGMRPKCNMVGDWNDGDKEGKGRSFYIGSRAAGKQTNVYEKGHQLFGEQDATGWIRAELRYGNKLRVIESDILRRPADFFAGASDWHASILREAEPEKQAIPRPIKVEEKLAQQTIEAEVTRNLRFLKNTAAASFALAFQFCDEEQFCELVANQKLPARLQKFSMSEIRSAYGKAHMRVIRGASAGRACEAL
ncbi:MAG: replication initiation factor domain-containing protein [Acidovorax sp.]|uniref:replication initiation factor domain-containing protein n=1 Tax=Acidovorax sp. TaxID=1872122 RepID=UPI0039E5607D